MLKSKKNINKKNILIIGGAGYIGSVTTELLIKTNNVVVYDYLKTGFKKLVHPQAKFINGKMADTNKLTKTIINHKIDLVVLLAAKIVVPESVKKPNEYYENNILGTISVLRAMASGGCKNIIFSSSAAVYGVPKKIPILENDKKVPCNPYGTSKLLSEQAIIDAAKEAKFNYVIFRFFNVAGASASNKYGMAKKNPTLLIPAINDAIIQNKKFYIYGNNYKTIDKTCLRDYVHVSDLANAHLLAIKYLDKDKSGIFNLGSNLGYTVKQVVDLTEKVLKKKINWEYKKNRQGDPDKLLTNNLLAKKELNWSPKHTIEDMIGSDFKFRKFLLNK